MIKFITQEYYLTEENRKIVFPLLFDFYYLKNEIIRSKFSSVSQIENADLAIVPIDIHYFFKTNTEEILYDFILKANQFNVSVWVYAAGDFGITLKKNVTTFRMGGFNSKLDSNTFIMPSFINDPYKDVFSHEWKPIQKHNSPAVGFVGNADGAFLKLLKEFLIYSRLMLQRIIKKDFTDPQRFFPSSSKRYKLLKKLETNSAVKTDFIYRNKYRGGAVTVSDRKNSTKIFYENIQENLYTFCLRGSGNFSVRFYETLMMGRIPLIINTDCRFPMEREIDWNQHCIIADEDNYIDKLVAFHNSKSNDELLLIQAANRKLALEDLNRVNYFIRMSELLVESR